ncbi:MAG: hypothetical protein VZR33_05560 [Methanosphaera sp.]|nr:hypothetical protein [Methanosphaera sp.]
MNNNNYVNNLSLILQVLSLEILFKDYNNSDLMQELQNQDNNYLKKIIDQNNLIIDLLKKGDKDAR